MLKLLKHGKKISGAFRSMSSVSLPDRKVTICGAAGGIGQPLSLLMKMNPAVSHLSLYDIVNTPGVAADVSHINTKAQVTAHGKDDLDGALSGADLVIIPAGVPRKPGMTRQDLFNINAGIVRTLTEGIARNCPGALINMISNPVNSTVPVAAETMKRMGVHDKRKILGVTTLDVVRAKTFFAEKMGLNIDEVEVPVVGGHAGITILPLFSQATPSTEMSAEIIDALTRRTQDGGTEVVQAKAGAGSATLSMAYAGALFGDACLRGLNAQKNVIECAYVESDVQPGVSYFSSKVRLGPDGVQQIYPIGDISEYEKEALDSMIPELGSSIETGEEFSKTS